MAQVRIDTKREINTTTFDFVQVRRIQPQVSSPPHHKGIYI